MGSQIPSHPHIILRRHLPTRIARIHHTLRLNQHQLHLARSERLMLHALRRDEHLARPKKPPATGPSAPARSQFSVGTRSTWSITSICTGTFAGSSFSPNCSCTAVKIDGNEESTTSVSGGAKFSFTSNFP